MKLADYSPPTVPTAPDQRDALRKGLGRAVQWARSGRLSEQALFPACLYDRRFDRSYEDMRSDWLLPIVRIMGAKNRLRPLLLQAFARNEERHSAQRCQLALWYARNGDAAFRKLLYSLVEAKPFENSRWAGEEEVLRLDGEQGFRFIARVRGSMLAHQPWDWDFESIVATAEDILGEECVVRVLASSDAAIRRLETGLREARRESVNQASPRANHEELLRRTTVETVITAAETGDDRFVYYIGWGRIATAEELEIILRRLRCAREPAVLARYLRVFSRCALPRFDETLIELCRHDDMSVRRLAYRATANNTHQSIRGFAVAEAQGGITSDLPLSLFVKNYRHRDEDWLFESITLPGDPSEKHWLLSRFRELFESQPAANPSKIGVAIYALTPCSMCRLETAELLHNRDLAPRWMLEECLDDAEEGTRKFAAASLSTAG